MKTNKILVTGGAGFIGSAFVRKIAGDTLRKNVNTMTSRVSPACKIIVLDSLTYAGDLKRLEEVKGKFKFYKADICDKKKIGLIFKKEKPDIVVNFAAETHVDRSILNSDDFLRTNILGVQVILEIARKFNVKRFVHISTDEVYGDIKKGKFCETTPLNPSSPYSASKASGDMLVKSYIRTFSFPAIIIRPSNNYGPWQYPEKFIPVIISKALNNKKVPIYAKGLNVREWLYVDDCARAILKVMDKGRIGETYNIGSGSEHKNIDIVKIILKTLNKPSSLMEFVKDRPGHDIRYSLESSKIRKELTWKSSVSFDKGIEKTISWYVSNFNWLENKTKLLKNYWNKVYK